MAEITQAAVKALKPRAERYIAWFDRGMGVRVAPSGKKTFIYWYRNGERKRLMTLGVFDTDPKAESLAKAKRAHEAARLDMADRVDPIEAKKERVAAAAAAKREQERATAARPTLRSIVALMKADKAFLAKKSSQEILKQIEDNILDFELPGEGSRLGDKPIDDLRKRDAISALTKVRQKGPRIADVCASHFVRLGKYAEKNDLFEIEGRNPLRNFERTPYKPKDRVLGLGVDELDDDRTWELQRVLERLPHVAMHPLTVLALLYILATGQRPGEVAEMPKAEVKKDGTLWTIPAARYKTSWRETSPKPHHVPLSSYAQHLMQLAAIYNEGSPWVFPSPLDPKKHMMSLTLPHAVRRKLGDATAKDEEPAPKTLGVAPFTPHDLRRTARSWMAALGVPDVVAELVIGHKLGGMVGVYNRHQYMDERREALQKWGDKLTELAPALLRTLEQQATQRKADATAKKPVPTKRK